MNGCLSTQKKEESEMSWRQEKRHKSLNSPHAKVLDQVILKCIAGVQIDSCHSEN